MTTSFITGVFLICGILTAVCHGVWYNILVHRPNATVELAKEQTPKCISEKSSLFYVSKNSPGIDQAMLIISSTVNKKLILCVQSDICHKCSLLKVTELKHGENKTVLVDTTHPIVLRVSYSTDGYEKVICRKHIKTHFGEHGHYILNILEDSEDKSAECNLSTVVNPVDSNIPIYVAIGIYSAMALLWIVIKYVYRKGWLYRLAFWMPTERIVNADLGTLEPSLIGDTASSSVVVPPKPRLRSLDTFRGISLLVMIFVNYAGGHYWFFHHAAWDGLTIADLVFPWFVFIMGTSIAIAFKSYLRHNVSRKKLFLKVIRRSLILFTLGLLVSNRAKKGREVSLSSLRIPGVLQRLAISYFVVAAMEVVFAQAEDVHQNKWWSFVRDIIPFWPEWLVAFILLSVHICLTFLLPVPGCPIGYLGPGGLHDNSSYTNCTGGAAGYIDKWFFGDHHVYQHPTTKIPYLTVEPHDPEGILGALTSIFLCFLGLQAGKIIIYHQDWMGRVKRWLLWCLLTGLVAGTLCEYSQYDGWIPVNKNLWSVSYILATASMAYFLLTTCYLLVDVFKYLSGAPFFFTGMNSIVVYICSEVFSIYFPIQFSVIDTHAAQLAMALWGTTIWCVMAAVLYYKKIFIVI